VAHARHTTGNHSNQPGKTMSSLSHRHDQCNACAFLNSNQAIATCWTLL